MNKPLVQHDLLSSLVYKAYAIINWDLTMLQSDPIYSDLSESDPPRC